MSQAERFLEMIYSAPEDDGPRLIFADWLEERGDPRSEFIRVQCRLDHHGGEDSALPEVKARELELLGEHEAEWVGPIRGLVSGWEFRRGFVEVVSMEAQSFLDRAGQLFRLAPIRQVKFLGAGRLTQQLAECPHLARLTGLHFTGNYLDDAALRPLVESPFVNGVKALHLAHNRIGNPGVRALAECPHPAGLMVLNLSFNRIGDTGAKALAGSPHLAGLISLNLAENYVTDAGARALIDSPHLTRLTALDLSQRVAFSILGRSAPSLLSGEVRQALRARFGESGYRA